MREISSPLDGFLSPFGQRRGGFSPLSLFASGEEGAWYDTSDISVLFQDTTGTTPITASGQTVGLVFDKSQGQTLGPELVTNGTFDTDSDWTLGTGWSIADGVASSDGTQTTRSSLFQGTLAVGKLCKFSMSVSGRTSGAVRLRNGIGAGEVYIADKSADGVYEAIFLVGSGGGNTTLVVDADADFVGSVDNISVKEIAGNHATQPIIAARPSYIVDADGAFIQHDPVDDTLTVTLPDLGTEATVAYVTRSEVRLLEDQTISGSYTLPAQELANFVVIDRALTFAEKVSLIRYLASKVEGVNYGAEIDRLTLIAVNAVDVFVYDTSKDSDGGAWATAYPAQMAIVAEATAVKIYDATDPGLPLHTTLDFTGYTVTALAAVSGVLAVATTTGLATFNLADGDETVALDYTTSTTPAIVNNACNDCAATVLPDAPTDPATGLPVPTIAVATDGGVSVIKDDGTVQSVAPIRYANHNYVKNVLIEDEEVFVTAWSSGQQHTVAVYDIKTLSFKREYQTFAPLGKIVTPFENGVGITINKLAYTSSALVLGSGPNPFNPASPFKGVGLIAEDKSDRAKGMSAILSSTYNTGWMPGDIKGAFLSDTDDADLVGGELVTNGTFDTDTSGWTAFSGASIASVGGQLEITGGATNTIQGAYTSISTVAGARYVLSVELDVTSAPNRYIRVGTTAGGGDIGVLNQTTVGSGQTVLYFVATTTTTYVSVAVYTTGQVLLADNISVRLSDDDRSVNANGLAIEGTITRTPVADGADLVAYSGFSASNYLEQPYNPDLDFGTGDFCVMGWFKLPAGGNQYQIIDRKAASGPAWQVKVENTAQKLYFSITDDFYTTRDEVLSSSAVDTDTWTFGCCVRSGSTIYVYVNGALAGSTAITNATGSLSNTSATMLVGIVSGGAIPFSGSLALWRISATAPTADQIAKIYNDEKVLFQDNVQATLYGASDAVTALAHDPDTGLLHVGTSAGRSIFEGLRRVGNTTTSVSTAISASGGLVVEK